MMLLLAYLTTLFVFIAFLTHPSVAPTFYATYYLSIFEFIRTNFVLSLLALSIFLGLFTRALHWHSTSLFSKKILHALPQLMGSLLVGSFLGLIMLLVIAFVQLNVLVVILDSNPALSGVVLDKKTIVSTLKQRMSPPDILATADSKEREVVGIAQNNTGTNSVYGKSILPAIPNLLILPIERPLSSMILADNTLIITKINVKDLQAVGKELGFLYVRNYFSDRKIKTSPTVQIMNSSEYVAHREQMATQRTLELAGEIQLVEEKAASLSAGITHDQEELTQAKKQSDQAAKDLDKQYRDCINAGEYQNGKYIHYYSQSYCQTQQENMSSSSDADQKDIDKWTTLLAYDQNQLSEYNSYLSFFKAQKALVAIGKANLPDELGVFDPPNNIQLSLQTNNSHAIADYIETLVHEYLHYASYTPGKKLSSSFFEEGLTEYFARQAIQDSLNISTNLGYPVEVKIIAQMTKRIDESEFEDIYFTKDEDHLEKTIDRVYGDDFYQKNISLFQTLMYTGDPDKQLQIANTIMTAIGGPKLQMKDMESSASTL